MNSKEVLDKILTLLSVTKKEEVNLEVTEINPFAGGHPVPPLPGQVLVEPNKKQGVLNG